MTSTNTLSFSTSFFAAATASAGVDACSKTIRSLRPLIPPASLIFSMASCMLSRPGTPMKAKGPVSWPERADQDLVIGQALRRLRERRSVPQSRDSGCEQACRSLKNGAPVNAVSLDHGFSPDGCAASPRKIALKS